jgi:mannose-6-phosphate isomerase-like protein (cupin superfamily)
MKTQDRPQVTSILAHRGEFFRVLQQTSRSQCAVMTIAPGDDGGPAEAHRGDQIVYVIEGEAVLDIAGHLHRAGAGTLVTIPAGVAHHVRNPGAAPLFFVTVYAPPQY